jgi:hypothetical protein
MLEPLVNLQPELETLMQVLCWALEKLFSRYAHGSCYSPKVKILKSDLQNQNHKRKEKKTVYAN